MIIFSHEAETERKCQEKTQKERTTQEVINFIIKPAHVGFQTDSRLAGAQ